MLAPRPRFCVSASPAPLVATCMGRPLFSLAPASIHLSCFPGACCDARYAILRSASKSKQRTTEQRGVLVAARPVRITWESLVTRRAAFVIITSPFNNVPPVVGSRASAPSYHRKTRALSAAARRRRAPSRGTPWDTRGHAAGRRRRERAERRSMGTPWNGQFSERERLMLLWHPPCARRPRKSLMTYYFAGFLEALPIAAALTKASSILDAQ